MPTREREAPRQCKHKPIYAINDYHKIDGYHIGDTDVHAISFGTSTWNKDEPSVKVWRKPNDKWSRQSEETTITRAIDMVSLIIQVLDKTYNSKEFEPLSKTVFGKVEIDTYATPADTIVKLQEYLLDNRDSIEQHIELLKGILDDYYDSMSI